jgi:hypothetical protein
MSILTSQPDVKEWSERDERPGRWVGITTWVECLAVERSGRCRHTSLRQKNLSVALRRQRRPGKYEQFFQQFNDTMHK